MGVDEQGAPQLHQDRPNKQHTLQVFVEPYVHLDVSDGKNGFLNDLSFLKRTGRSERKPVFAPPRFFSFTTMIIQMLLPINAWPFVDYATP